MAIKIITIIIFIFLLSCNDVNENILEAVVRFCESNGFKHETHYLDPDNKRLRFHFFLLLLVFSFSIRVIDRGVGVCDVGRLVAAIHCRSVLTDESKTPRPRASSRGRRRDIASPL